MVVDQNDRRQASLTLFVVDHHRHRLGLGLELGVIHRGPFFFHLAKQFEHGMFAGLDRFGGVMFEIFDLLHFGHLGLENQSFGNLMKEAGYATCISGIWQLNGLSYKEQLSDWNDPTRPQQLGFDEYCLWQLTRARKEGERYANPLIERNGKLLDREADAYGPDLFANFVLDFIERHSDQP